MWPEWIGSKVPPNSAMCRPPADFAPRMAALCAFRMARMRRAGIRFAARGSFALLCGLPRGQPLQGVGHAAHKFRDAFAGGRGYGVKIELALRAMLAQPFQAGTVRGGVQLRRHHDHRFCRQRLAESSELATDNCKIA